MKISHPTLLFTALNFSPGTNLLERFEDRTGELVGRHHRLLRVRLTITRESSHQLEPNFAACARLEQAGSDAIVHARGADAETAGDAALEKLERISARHNRRRRHARRHPRAAECGINIPRT